MRQLQMAVLRHFLLLERYWLAFQVEYLDFLLFRMVGLSLCGYDVNRSIHSATIGTLCWILPIRSVGVLGSDDFHHRLL